MRSFSQKPSIMAKQPKWGPGYQPVDSLLYRAEYAVLFLSVIVYLGWRGTRIAGTDVTIYWAAFAFWIVFPDLAAFIPIGLASRNRQWPNWGYRLYNTIHTMVVWALAFGASWILFGSPYWPIMGWLGQ